MSEPPLPSARRKLLFSKYGHLLTTPFFFGFSTHILTPSSFSRFLGARSDLYLTNSLYIGSHIGVTIYLYTSKHLRNAQPFDRLLYSIYGSTIFNFGTVLVMSIIRSIFPDDKILRLGIGLPTSLALLYIGKRYISYIDHVFDTIRFRAIPKF